MLIKLKQKFWLSLEIRRFKIYKRNVENDSSNIGFMNTYARINLTWSALWLKKIHNPG